MLWRLKQFSYFYLINNINMKALAKWFELNLGWFFINGRKQEAWARYLRRKYGKEEK